MKRKKIKVSLFSLLLTASLLVMGGCEQNGLPEDTDSTVEYTVSEDHVSEDVISENDASVNEVSENIISENPVSEEEEPETVYIIDKEDIVNLEEAFENWSDIDDTQREMTFEEGYVDNDIPTELQDMIIYYNDGIDDERDDYIKEYIVDCEEITEENVDNYPMEEIAWDVYLYNCKYDVFKIIDLDSDGENEYFHSVQNGKYGGSYLCFHKKVDDKWLCLTLYGPYILLYDGRYYVWSGGNCLSCWNDEVETVRENGALIEEDNPCWNRVVWRELPTEYTLYELYSNVHDDSIDFLENISLDWGEYNDYIRNEIERVEIESSDGSYYSVWWETDRGRISPRYGWERSYNGEQYLYVATVEFIGSNDSDVSTGDDQLIIMHETQDGAWEIDKVYYLMTGYDCKLSPFVRENN